MAPSFRQTPPKILFHNANNFGGGHFRILLPARLLRQNGFAVAQASMQTLEKHALEVMRPDSVVFQHLHSERHIEQMRGYRKSLKHATLIYEIDDVFWQVPESSIHKAMVPADIKAQMAKAASVCDAMTVTTKPLAAVMRSAFGIKDIRVIPNQLPKSFINAAIAAARSERPRSDKLRVGWAGGIGHTGDLRIVAEVMDLLGDVVDWVFMGMAPPGIDPARYEEHPAAPFETYAEALGALHLDIALAPLEANLFNECKSDLRVLEYGACGFAVIASDITPYAECPVIRVPNKAQDWADAITDLLRNPDLRYEQAEALHVWVQRERCMEAHLLDYERAYIARNATPFRPTAVQRSGKIVTVGQSVADLEHFPSLAAASAAEPAADILYIRPGTPITPLQVARLADALGNHASVCPLSNDGGFPRQGMFSPISQDTAAQLDEAAIVLGAEPTQQPYPNGPCVLLSAQSIARFGVPDERRFDGPENALLDWGARAAETGNGHIVASDIFVQTLDAPQTSREDIQALTENAALWTPPFLGALQSTQGRDPRKEVREDLDLTFHSLNYKFPLPDQGYGDWTAVFDTLSETDVAAIVADQESWEGAPTISVIMPVYNPDENFLGIAIESVLHQAYPHWTLCIADDGSTNPGTRAMLEMYAKKDSRIHLQFRAENGHICHATNTALEAATGEWVCFLDHDDALAPHALYMVAREIKRQSTVRFIYSDSDKISPQGSRVDPYFAPDFNYELLLGQNYVTHLCAYRLDGVRKVGGMRPGYEGSQDWDLTLRYLEAECASEPYSSRWPHAGIDPTFIRHIPHILYHWRQAEGSTAASIAAKPYALEAGRRAVIDHLVRTKQSAAVTPHPLIPIFNLVRFLVPENPPLVSIIILTRGSDLDMLQQCVGSIMQRTAYQNIEVLLVNTAKPEQPNSPFNRLLAEFTKNPLIRVIPMPGPFNYSSANNRAVKLAKGEYLCLLNDDTEILESAWLNDMVGAAMRPGIGAVGPKLIYPNGTVQQCGTIFDPNAPPLMSALHAHQQLPVTHPGHFGRAMLPAQYTAVTAACLVIKRTAWEAVGGFDESFALDYGDVDLCLWLGGAGYRNLVLPQIVVRHNEGATKRKVASPEAWTQINADERRLRERHKDARDPFVNHNLAHDPQFDKLRVPAPLKPWESEERSRVLLINGTKEDAFQAYRRGEIAFCATLEGHLLRFTYPIMRNVAPLDLRESPDAFLAVLGKLGVPAIAFCGIGDGTLGAVGFLAAVAALGWSVRYTPNRSARGENPNDYVDPAGWKATWDGFLAAIADAPAPVRLTG